MLRFVAVAAAVAVGATVSYAQNLNIIKERKEGFKAMAAAAKEPGAMVKGEAKFDLPKVQAALKAYQQHSPKLKDLFPADSKTGGDTEALPVIWDKMADVGARFDKLAADAKAAEGTIKDEASFKAEWPKVMGNCGGCHKEYRVQK